jgi:histidyl-tRNA synthetase
MASAALPGFRDFYPEELARRAHIFGAWRAVARKYAFVEYDGPPLEPLDLYTKKSGDEIVGQLYNFTDKGGREVSLRPEMTPTFARMVGAKASALRKPVRWFSIPQLFRYERAQRGRLREHFQLNVDIVGEASEVADAELLCVAVDIMRELGLSHEDVRARVSDRRLATELIQSFGLPAEAVQHVFATFDKLGRTPRAAALNNLAEKLAPFHSNPDVARALVEMQESAKSPAKLRDFAQAIGLHLSAAAETELQRFERYLAHCEALGVGAWIDLDLSIVRGLAYYTGVVFELFDAKGELRAICGGGRYDDLLKAIGGTDLPALGFGMGDVVLGELLTERGLWPEPQQDAVDFAIVAGNGAINQPYADVLKLARALRDAGFSVSHGLNEERYKSQATRNQVDGARKAGASAVIYFREDGAVEAMSLLGKMTGAATHAVDAGATLSGDAQAMQALRHWLQTQRAR